MRSDPSPEAGKEGRLTFEGFRAVRFEANRQDAAACRRLGERVLPGQLLEIRPRRRGEILETRL